MSNPIDEFFEEYTPKEGKTKEASFSAMMSQIPSGAAQGLAMGVTGGVAAAAAAGIGVAAHKAYLAATKQRDFNKMLEFNPALKAQKRENPKMFNQAFSSLRNMNPEFSKDPLVAGQYMEQIMDGNVGGLIDASAMRKNFPTPVMDQMQRSSADITGRSFLDAMDPGMTDEQKFMMQHDNKLKELGYQHQNKLKEVDYQEQYKSPQRPRGGKLPNKKYRR